MPDRNSFTLFHAALTRLYFPQPHDGALTLALTDDFDESVWREAVRRVFKDKGYQPSTLRSPEAQALISETYRHLRKAVNLGLSQQVSDTLRNALQENAFIFSGFKSYHTLRELGLSLLDQSGNIKPFEQFLNDVQTVNAKYNRHYLNAEYKFAVSSSQMAERWQNVAQGGDRYNLQYRTAGDERVREEHAALDGITLPPTDPFWTKYYPPNGWGCRCTATQVRKDKFSTSDPKAAMQAGDACTEQPKQRIFRFNPGKELKIYPSKHPYFPKGCGSCPSRQSFALPADTALNLAYDPKRESCRACKQIQTLCHTAHNREIYERLTNDPDYNDVQFDEKSGGLKATHREHIVKKKKEFFGRTMSDYDLETECQNELFSWGNRAILRNEHASDKSGSRPPALDLDLNGHIMDIRSITKGKHYGNALMEKNDQIKRFQEKTGKESDSVLLYFHDPDMFSEETLRNDIEWYKNRIVKWGSEQRIHKVYVAVKGAGQLQIFDA